MAKVKEWSRNNQLISLEDMAEYFRSIYGIEKQVLDSVYNDRDTLLTIFNSLTAINTLFSIKTTLDSLFADKITLDSIYTDRTKLSSLYADKATLDGLFESKSAIDSLFTDKTTLDSIFADKTALDAIYANLTEILTVDENTATVVSLFDQFDDRYLGSKASAPTIDNDGNPLLEGALYWDSTQKLMRGYDGTTWVNTIVQLVDNLTTADSTRAATANVVKILKDLVDTANANITTNLNSITAILTSIGAVNGITPLNGVGVIDAQYLPSFVDDVIEVATYANLPVTGEPSKIYIVSADETSGGNTSSYRWTGTVYAMVSNTLTAADIKALYEANANTNEFSDAEKSKLGGVDYPVPAFPADEGLALVARATGNDWEKILGLPLETGKKGMNVTNHGVEGDSFWTPVVTNPNTITADVVIDTGVNASMVDPTINDGVTITVPDGSTLVIL